MRVPITIAENANISRPGEVMTVGVPFAVATVWPQTPLAMTDVAGNALPTQWRSLAVWPDGSVQRALIHFQADVEAAMAATFHLIDAEPAPAPANVLASHGDGEITVDTGALRFALDTDGRQLFKHLHAGEVALLSTPCTLFTVGADGRRYTGSVISADIEESGPLRAVICCRGRHRGDDCSADILLDFELRLTVTTGSGLVSVQHTFINRSVAASVDVSEIGLSLPLIAGSEATIEEALGHVSARSDNGTVTAVIERYTEQFPKAMAVTDEVLRIWLRPPQEQALTLVQGIAKTHVLHLTALAHSPSSGQGASDAAQKAQWRARLPVRAMVTCDAYNSAEVSAAIMPRRGHKYPWLEQLLQDSFRWCWLVLPAEIPETVHDQRVYYCKRLYGMLDYGDYSRLGRCYVQNLEHDLPRGLFLQYLRLGDPACREAMTDTVLHMMDVDVCHFRDPAIHEPSGCYFPGGMIQHDPRHNVRELRMTISHVWVEGILEYYFMTGYSRALEVAKGVGENLLINIPKSYDHKTLARHHGWPLVAVTALYRATGDVRYLACCELMLTWLKEWQADNGHFPRNEGVAHLLGPFAQFDGRPFGVGVMLKGVAAYYRIKPDEELKAFFLKAVDGVIDAFESAEGLFKTPELQGYAIMLETVLILDGLALAYELTGKKSYLEKGLFNLKYALHHWLQYDQMRDTLRFTTLLVAIFPFLNVADSADVLEDIRLI